MPPKKQKRSCPFSSSKPRAKKKSKSEFDKQWAAKLAESDKGSVYRQEKWLEELDIQKSKKCYSCCECKPLQNPARRARRRKPIKLNDLICLWNVENNKRSSYRIEREAASETGRVCILSILPGKSPSHGRCSD